MLDKIKVYRRSDAYELDFFSLKFQKYEPMVSLINNDVIYYLTKADPLNKFKKEMEGWWFCEECVVICGNDAIYSVTYRTEKEKFGYIEFRKNIDIENPLSIFDILNQGKKFAIQDINEYNGWGKFFGKELPTIKDLPLTYSLLGEDKYFKLLELLK